MMSEFHHCHSEAMFAQTEAVCQPQPAHLVQNYLKICSQGSRKEEITNQRKNTGCCLIEEEHSSLITGLKIN